MRGFPEIACRTDVEACLVCECSVEPFLNGEGETPLLGRLFSALLGIGMLTDPSLQRELLEALRDHL